MRRSATATAVQLGGVDADAKLALLEFLLSNTDLQISARRAVDWLAAHSPAEQAVVLVAQPGSSALLLIAEHGVSSSAVGDFALTRDDEGHPIVVAMERSDATYFDGASTQFHLPIEGLPFHAIPLRGDDDSIAHWLLLASATAPQLHPDVAWVARILGRQGSRLPQSRSAATTRSP